MATSISTLTGTSATGDLITGPGYPTVLVNGLPVATMTSAVSGAACTGVISSTMSPTNLCGGLPVASLTCTVTGVNPATGAPVTTTEAVSTAVTVLA